ncbi:MAG: response regulator transcription factor [Oscillospiraceae bacterium]
MANVLVCDDDHDIVAALKIYLSSEEHTVFSAQTGREALDCLRDNSIDLVLMDIMMPEMDGIAATAKLREDYNIPVILLTAKSESSDKVLGLGIGADDYVTKPFDPAELLARVKSQLRRYTRLGGEKKANSETLSSGGIELDDAAKTVEVDGAGVNLTPIEFSILRLLLRNPNRVFSSAQIYESVWNDTAIGSESSVAVHIRHLREKIEINPGDPRYIKVVWGQGYKLEDKG